MNNILLGLLALLFAACKNGSDLDQVESPLTSIIKLQSAQESLELEEARKYIDVEKVYDDPDNDSTSAEVAWKEMLGSMYKLSKNSKIFDFRFKYFEYHISESIQGDRAQVVFESNNQKTPIRAIIYKLELANNRWIVNSITYAK